VKDPQRGEVWLVDLGLAAKVRPALVLSVPPGDADRALVTLVPHTTALRQTAFEVPLLVRFLKPGAFDPQSLVSIPLAKLVRRLGVLGAQELEAVERGVVRWLGLPSSG
jgi:mRNA interferase MazF